jgi:hypothetical protein
VAKGEDELTKCLALELVLKELYEELSPPIADETSLISLSMLLRAENCS